MLPSRKLFTPIRSLFTGDCFQGLPSRFTYGCHPVTKGTGKSIATSTMLVADRSISSKISGTSGHMFPVITSTAMSAMAKSTVDIIVNKSLMEIITDASLCLNWKIAHCTCSSRKPLSHSYLVGDRK